MSKKSTRAASTTHRRNLSMWADLESARVGRSNENVICAQNAAIPSQTIRGGFVTPSPNAKIAKKKKSQKIRSSGTNLFLKNNSRRRRNLTTNACEPTFAESKKISYKIQKRLFARNICSDPSATINVDVNVFKRRVPKNTSSPLATKAMKSGRNNRGKFSLGDSLAFFENITPPTKKNPNCNRNDGFDSRNRFNWHPIEGGKEKNFNEQRKAITKPILSVPKKGKTSQIGNVVVAKKNCSSDGNNKTIVKRKPISDELVSLLAFPSKKKNKKARTRSTVEILDEFQKELKLKHGRRASLPRACKKAREGRFREILTDEDTDGESEDEKNDDQLTTNIKISKMNKCSRNEESTWECPSIIRSPTNATLLSTNKSPMPNTLKTRPRTFFWSSSLFENQSKSSRLVHNVREPRALGLPSKKQPRSITQNRENNNFSTKVNQVKTSFALLFHDYDSDKDPNRGKIHCESRHEKKLQPEPNEQPIYKEQGRQLNRNIFVNNVCVSSKFRKDQQQSTLLELEKEPATSHKRVRFDSATTTFSVKIKVKTNFAGGGQKNASGCNQTVPFPSSLNESAVQTIANHLTQAYLTQARTTAGIGGSMNEDINLNLSMNEGEFSNQMSDKSCNCVRSSHNLTDERRKNEFIHSTSQEINSYRGGTKCENGFMTRKDFDDGRSITSDLTNDWNRSKPSRLNDLGCQKEENKQIGDTSQDTSIYLVQKVRNKTDQNLNIADNIEKSRICLKRNRHQKESIISNKIRSARRLSKTSWCGESQCHSSLSRKQHLWSCSDSLAGSPFRSISSSVARNVSNKIPKEVSLCKSLELAMCGRTKQKEVDKKDDASTILCEHSNLQKVRRIGEGEESKTEGLPVNLITPTTSQQSLLLPLLPTYRCGECKGCRRVFDCQTCDACLTKIHFYGSIQIPRMEEGVSLCLSRRCRRTCRVGFVDSLLGLNSSCNQNQSTNQVDNKSEHGNALFRDKLSHQKLFKNSMSTNNKAVKDVQDYISKITKAPWDDGDDWTVDYSYLFEPKYHPHWNKNDDSNGSTKSLSSAKDFSSVSWWLPVNEKQKSLGFGSGERTSPCSIFESVVSQKLSTKTITSTSLQNEEDRGVRKRIGKRKRDPLHGLALPCISRGASSVTSWRAIRKCLHALMEYGETDQDWE